MGEQIAMTEVLEQTAVAQKPKETLVEFYVQVHNQETGTPFYVQWVTYVSKAKFLTSLCRGVGMKCGYNYNFKGKRMSSKPQVGLAFTVINKVAKAAGVEVKL
jgi:hypothetical protein